MTNRGPTLGMRGRCAPIRVRGWVKVRFWVWVRARGRARVSGRTRARVIMHSHAG